ncbi:zinc finger and SCAN domain-containing protein 2 [Bombina bombina]|uniref:zinc finger and SCAN domain-containing protein 2 n=1 Tax=Bombina bombina TaxID=8345 RepID=UPI00235A8C7E|nr:zinc finger and SCAN domain-containing protein 2 [Bombina bombina]
MIEPGTGSLQPSARGDTPTITTSGNTISSTQNGLISPHLMNHGMQLMNNDLSSFYARDSSWDICSSNGLQATQSGNSPEKVVHPEKNQSDITSIIAHLRSLATETSQNCVMSDVDCSDRSNVVNSESPENKSTNGYNRDNNPADVIGACNKTLVDFQEQLSGEIIDGQYSFSSEPITFKVKSSSKSYICSDCGKSCPCRSAYIRHQRIHTGEKPYSCSECGKSFIQSSDYNNHVRSHTGEKPYSCGVCGKSFSRSTYLVTHSRIHTQEKPYMCNVCGKSFIQHSHLALHLRIHSGEKPYICIECGNSFSRSSTLVKHKKSHRRKTLHMCKKKNEEEPHCNFTQNNPPTWGSSSSGNEMHKFLLPSQPPDIKSENNDTLQVYQRHGGHLKRYKCGKKIMHKPIRIILKKYHIYEKDSEEQAGAFPRRKKCLWKRKSQFTENDIGDSPLIYGTDLPSNEPDKATSPESERESSPEEDKGENRGSSPKRDRDRMSSPGKHRDKGSSPEKHRCRVSSPEMDSDLISSPGKHRGGGSSPEKVKETVPLKIKLSSRVRDEGCPKKDSLYSCTKNEDANNRRQEHKEPIDLQMQVSDREILREVDTHPPCSYTDMNSSQFGYISNNAFIDSNSTGNFNGDKVLDSVQKPCKASAYICSYCGKSCPCKSAFLRHQRIHTGEKPYSCSVCGKSFIQSSDYNNHLRSHTGEKPYACAECGKSFSRSTYLVTHSRTHTKEKPYTCIECGKSFVQHSHLALHLRIHSGEKPYTCAECGKRFSRSSTLVKHQKSHSRKNITADWERRRDGTLSTSSNLTSETK